LGDLTRPRTEAKGVAGQNRDHAERKLTMKPIRVAWLAVLLLAPVSIARADLTIEMKYNKDPMATYVTSDKLASTTTQGGMIFLGKEKVLRIVDSANKKYTEMTEEDAKAMGAQMADMQKTLEQLPPAMREKVGAAMRGRMPGATDQRTVKPLGTTKTINGFETAGYLVTTGAGDGETEVWAAPAKKLGIDTSDTAVFKDLAAFMQTMVPGLDAMRELIKDYEKPNPGDVPGFPVLTIHRDKGGKEVWRSELVKVDKSAVPAERFAVPAGFKKEKMKFGQ
jgi:hypothetical protein